MTKKAVDIMKKILMILLVLLLMCSCAAQNPQEQPEIDIQEELFADEVPDVFLDFGFSEWNIIYLF